jgi:hypothetical protein
LDTGFVWKEGRMRKARNEGRVKVKTDGRRVGGREIFSTQFPNPDAKCL